VPAPAPDGLNEEDLNLIIFLTPNDFPLDKYATTRFCGSSFRGFRPNTEIEALKTRLNSLSLI
jgi:hypothetical protein